MPESGAFGPAREVLSRRRLFCDQVFTGQPYCELRLACDDSQIGSFQEVQGEVRVEEWLERAIGAAVAMSTIERF